MKPWCFRLVTADAKPSQLAAPAGRGSSGGAAAAPAAGAAAAPAGAAAGAAARRRRGAGARRSGRVFDMYKLLYLCKQAIALNAVFSSPSPNISPVFF
jgi:hypothetical protein